MRSIPLLALLLLAPSAGAAQQDPERGHQLYLEHCAKCHGEAGHGDGETAERLGFHPRDFTLGAFKCRSTPSGSSPTDEDLTRIVARGMRGTPMTGFDDDMEPGEIADLVAYVRTLIPAPEGGEPPPVLEVPDPPEPSAASLAAGRAIYGLLRCWNCHGVDGTGDGPAADGLEDKWGDPIEVYDFTRRNRYKCGGTPEDIYRTLHTGMTGSPMASFTTAFAFGRDQVGKTDQLEEVLGDEAVDAILAWLASQPTAEELRASEAERQEVIERRTWALVDYLKSLEAE